MHGSWRRGQADTGDSIPRGHGRNHPRAVAKRRAVLVAVRLSCGTPAAFGVGRTQRRLSVRPRGIRDALWRRPVGCLIERVPACALSSPFPPRRPCVIVGDEAATLASTPSERIARSCYTSGYRGMRGRPPRVDGSPEPRSPVLCPLRG